MKNATLSSCYNSSAFDPPESPLMPSDLLVGLGFDDQLIDLIDEIEREEGFGRKINWCVAAIKAEALMLEEIQLADEGEYEFSLAEMKSEFVNIIKDCD